MFELPKIKVTVQFRAPSAGHPAETAPIEKIPFEIDSQGCKLRGFILRPKRAGRLPAVIVSHGFASCTRDTKKYARVFADEGFAAVCFDFCMSGSGRSTGSSLGMSVLTEKADLFNVLDYVKGLDYVDPARITLAGCSQGGLVSALAAAEQESEVERLVLYYPALCIPDDARRGHMINAKFDPDRVLIRGVVCGVRVEEVADPLMREARYLDKLVDELAKGKPLEKVLRTSDMASEA